MIICGTGHRPDKLGGYGEQAFSKLFYLASDYLEETRPDKVISGMALGWDQALADAAIDLDIPLIAAVPFLGQERMWPKASKDKYNILLERASDIIYVCDQGYAPWKMQVRNEWMVDHCDLVVALWNGTEGGTCNCLKYADKKKKDVINLWERYESA